MKVSKHIIIIFFLLFTVSTKAQVSIGGKNYTVQQCIENADKYEEQGDFREATNFLNGVAFYLWEEKNYDQAIDLFNRSVSLNEKINNIGGIAGIESNLGMIYNDKRDYTKALTAFEKALEIRTKQNEKLPILKTHVNISVVLNNLSRFDEAIDNLNEALKIAGSINDVNEMKLAYAMLSETYDKKGDRIKAKEYFDLYRALDEGAQRAREANIQASLDKIQQNLELTETERSNKEIELALKEKQLHDRQEQFKITDSINQVLSEQIQIADLKLHSLEREEAINELRRQKIESQLQNEQQIRLFIIIVIVVLLIFLAILYGVLRRIQRLNKLLTIKNEDVSRQRKSLEDENRVRTKILSIISHDLRTPLSAVYLFLQILRSKTLSPEMVDNHLIKLESSLNSSFQMLDNVLYWAKKQINGIKHCPEVIDIVESIDANLKFVSTSIQNKAIEVINNIEGIIYIYADKEMLNIILRNIISNAVKFTPQDGIITLSYKKEGQFACVSIADTGVGISKEKQATLFTPQVVSQNGTAKETGSGLGLLLAQDFVNMNYGKITFESEENVGTTFYICLPLANMEQLKQKVK